MKKLMQSAMAATVLATSFTATAAKKNTFQAVTSQLDQNSDYFNYSRFNVQGTVDGVSTWLQKMMNLNKKASAQEKALFEDGLHLVNLLLKDSGAFDIQAIGQSSLNKGDHYLNKSLLYSSSTEGSLFKIMGAKSHDLTALNFLPKQTVLATSSDVNLEVLWTQLAKVAAKSKNPQIQMGVTMLPGILSSQGVDLNKLLNSLDQEMGFFVCADESKMVEYPIDRKMVKLPKMDATLFLKTKTPYLSEILSQKLPLAQFKKSNFDAYTVYEVPSPMPLLTPTFAISDSYIFFSLDKSRLLESLQNFKDKQGLVMTEAFSKLSKGIPSEANGFSYFSASSYKLFMSYIDQFVNQPGAKEKVSFFKDLAKENVFFYGVNQVRPDGLMAINNFTLRQDTLGGGGTTTVATTGILAAMIMPALAKSKAKAKQATSKNNLKQFGANVVNAFGEQAKSKKVLAPSKAIAFEGVDNPQDYIYLLKEGEEIPSDFGQKLEVIALEKPGLFPKYSRGTAVVLADFSVRTVYGKFRTVDEVLKAAALQFNRD